MLKRKCRVGDDTPSAAGFEIAVGDAEVHTTSADIGLSDIGRADLAADDVREATARIRKSIGKLVRSFIDIGNDLIIIKAGVGHGNFLPWIKTEFGMTEKTAQRYMSIAREYKNDMVSNLPPTVLYALAAKSTPPEVRAEAIEMAVSSEKVTTKVVAGLKSKHEHTKTKPAVKSNPAGLADLPDDMMVCPDCHGSGLGDHIDDTDDYPATAKPDAVMAGMIYTLTIDLQIAKHEIKTLKKENAALKDRLDTEKESHQEFKRHGGTRRVH